MERKFGLGGYALGGDSVCLRVGTVVGILGIGIDRSDVLLACGEEIQTNVRCTRLLAVGAAGV